MAARGRYLPVPRRAAGEPLGPLAGVPFSAKENVAIEGVATTHGIQRFRDLIARGDAPAVSRLREAGAIPLAHTNMPDLSIGGMHPRSQLFGETKNPWDPSRTPGGSSGGDGVAVASGMVPLGIGNDSGGSIRIPATFCGVAGLKPSFGRIPCDHRIGPEDPTLASQLFPVDGPLARTVADLRAVFAVLAGADPRDPRSVPVPLCGPEIGGKPRVAVVTNPGGSGVHTDVRIAVRRAADALADAGYAVDEIADVPRLEDALQAYGRMIMTEFSLVWPAVAPLLSDAGRRYVEMSIARAGHVDLAGYLRLTAARMSIQRAWAEFQTSHPLVLGPVFSEPAVEPGIECADDAGHARVTRAMRLCSATSFVGVPAVAVPVGLVDGLPQGVQVIGPMYREDLCFDAAEAIEARAERLTPVDPRVRASPGASGGGR